MIMDQNKNPEVKKKLPPGITLRKDGRYQGRFSYQGKRYTLYDRDLKILKRKLADAKYEAEHYCYIKETKITLNEWYLIWLNEYKRKVVKGYTLHSYQATYQRYIESTLGKLCLTDIKTLHIQKFYNDLFDKGLCSGSIRLINALLSNIFNQAIRNEMLGRNPCIGVVISRNDKKSKRTLSLREQELFIRALEGNYYRPMFLLALTTGMRIGEIGGLTWDNINFEHAVLTINKTLIYYKDENTKKHEYFLQTPKTNTSNRVIPLLDVVINLLLEQKKTQEELKTERKNQWTPLSGMDNLVFTTRNGTPVQEIYAVKRLYRISKKMNELEQQDALLEGREPVLYEKISPHILRHTFASRAFELGIQPKTVQELLGHSSIKITMDLYTHITFDTKVKEMQKMNNLYSSLSK